MITFDGNGVVYIPAKRSFITFVGGKYSTADDDEITCLAQSYQPDKDVVFNVSKDGELSLAKDEPPKRGRPRSDKGELNG